MNFNSCREKWANYFYQHGILFLFWSAKAASAAASAASDLGQQDDVCGRDELLARLQSEAEGIVSMRGESRAQVRVGFVGYPNVGKSSTINALCGKKRTGVTSTPGKTKLCQTFKMSEKLEIWDCPGLVFPSFTRSKHDMIASGVLPIDRLMDHRAAVQVVADRVSVIERVYNIALPKPKPYEPKSRPPLASELLRAYCASRRHVASSGLPDETRASRQILKDYINGKLPHYEMPPGVSDVEDDGDDDDDLNCFDKLPHLEMPPGMSDDEERETDGPVVEDGDDDDKLDLECVLDDLKSFDVDNGFASTVIAVKKSSSKHHKKPQRKKSRLWRVTNDGGDGMPIFRKPARGGGPVTAY